jgi:hypothetical protein
MLQKKNTTCFCIYLFVFFITNLGFAQFDIPKNPIFKLVCTTMQSFDAEKHN